MVKNDHTELEKLSFIFWNALPDGKRNLDDWQGHVGRSLAHQIIPAATFVHTLKDGEKKGIKIEIRGQATKASFQRIGKEIFHLFHSYFFYFASCFYVI